MSVRMFLVCTVLLLIAHQPLEASKVLMIPFQHINIFRSLGRALADDGHEPFLITATKYLPQLEGYNVTPISFPLPENADFGARLEKLMEKDPTGKTVVASMMAEFTNMTEYKNYCDILLSNITLMDAIREEPFDLAVMDGSIGCSCTYTIPYKYDIPYITFHGMSTASWAAGVTGMPSIEPDTMLEMSNRMSFWQRLINFHVWLASLEDPFMPMHDQHFLQTYAPEKPYKKLNKIVRESEMFLLNYEVLCLDYPRVSAPHYQYLGGSTIKSGSSLPEDLDQFVQGADHGIVIMSIGSFTAWRHVWLVLRDKMFSAFGKLKQRVIVQYNLEELPKNVPENVHIMQWIPQLDLLAHPKTQLFITHGGNNGQNEAVYHGIPMLVIPILIDQPYAGVRAEAKGYGKYVQDKESITSEELVIKMEQIISNESYSRNIKKCSKIMRSMPTAQQRFVFWVNHILEFGGSHLRPQSLDMPFYEVFMLDIMALYVGIGLICIHCMVGVMYLLCRCICKKTEPKGKTD